MARQYSFIYTKLVKSDEDLVGLIAYGIYKRHKIEFIKGIQEQFKREPTDEECNSFFISSTTDSQLKKYRNDAESLLSEVVVNTTAEELDRYEKEMLASYQENLKKSLPPGWHNVIWSVIASFIFAGMGLFFYHVGITSNQNAKPQTVEIRVVSDSIKVHTPEK